MKATIIAGIAHINGHRYGTNSNNQAIRASDHLLGRDNQNNHNICNDTNTTHHI